MSWTPPPHTPYQWHDSPQTDTPLNAADLIAAENDLVGYTQQTATSLYSYLNLPGQQLNPVTVPSGPYNANVGDLVEAQVTGGPLLMTLPTAPRNGAVVGVQIGTQAIDPTTQLPAVVVISAGGSDVFSTGSTFRQITQLGELIIVQYNTSATTWFTVGRSVNPEVLDDRYVLNTNPSKISGELDADAVGVMGVPGLTTPIIFMGAITSITGAPTSGTWQTYSAFLDGAGVVQYCTAGGTPGNWLSGGVAGVAPVAVTSAATLPTQTSMQLNATVNPGGLLTTFHFEWGTTTSYGSNIPITDVVVASDSTVHAVSQTLTGLTANTTYHYTIVATNSAGQATGSDQSFTTLAAAPTPTISGLSSSAIQQTTATVAGSVNPNGATCTYQFQLGTDTSYGTNLPASPGTVTLGNVPVAESANFTGLTANTTYHWRLQAVGANGTVNSSDQTFTTLVATPAPTVVSQSSSVTGQTTATVNATVNPNGAATTYQFQYGTTTGYGTNVPGSAASIGSGTANVAVPAGALTSLTANTLYHWRVQAINANGTTNGADQTFTTQPSAAPTVVTNAATSLTTTTATLNGTVNPNSTATTWQYQYGTDTTYGSLAPAAAGSAGSGSGAVSEPAPITGLTPNTTYHFRLTATNGTGTTNGADQTFTTVATATTVPIKFSRLTYTNTFPNSFATSVSRGNQLYLLQADGRADEAPDIKAAAAAAGQPMKVLFYSNIPQTDPGDAPGLTFPIAYSTANANGYLAVNAAGHRINTTGHATRYLLNLTNAGAQAAIVSHITALAQQGQFDGVWFDNSGGSLTGLRLLDATSGGTTTPTFASTNSQWEDVMANLFAVIVPQLNANGLVVFGNIANTNTNAGKSVTPAVRLGPIIAGNPKTGGVYFESWTDGGAGLAQQMTSLTNGIPGDFASMQNAIALDSAGVKVMCNTQNTTAAGQIFGLAAMMLCTTGNCYYMTDYLSGDNWNTPQYATALASGSATSGVVTPGTANGTGADAGLYVRTFQNCTVKVNFNTSGTINGVAGLTATIA